MPDIETIQELIEKEALSKTLMHKMESEMDAEIDAVLDEIIDSEIAAIMREEQDYE